MGARARELRSRASARQIARRRPTWSRRRLSTSRFGFRLVVGGASAAFTTLPGRRRLPQPLYLDPPARRDVAGTDRVLGRSINGRDAPAAQPRPGSARDGANGRAVGRALLMCDPDGHEVSFARLLDGPGPFDVAPGSRYGRRAGATAWTDRLGNFRSRIRRPVVGRGASTRRHPVPTMRVPCGGAVTAPRQRILSKSVRAPRGHVSVTASPAGKFPPGHLNPGCGSPLRCCPSLTWT